MQKICKNIQVWKSAVALVWAVLGITGLPFGLVGVLYSLILCLHDTTLNSMFDVIVAFASLASPAIG